MQSVDADSSRTIKAISLILSSTLPKACAVARPSPISYFQHHTTTTKTSSFLQSGLSTSLPKEAAQTTLPASHSVVGLSHQNRVTHSISTLTTTPSVSIRSQDRLRHSSDNMVVGLLPLVPLKKTSSHIVPQHQSWEKQEQEDADSERRHTHTYTSETTPKSPVKKVAGVASALFALHAPPPAKNPDLLFDILKQPAEQLSNELSVRMSYFDVLLLFFELMKLEVTSQEDEKMARRKERQVQLKYLEQEVANFKSQAKWMLFSYVGAGVLGIASGLAPIVGHMKGESILNTFSSVFSSLKGAKKKDFFEGISKMTYAMSEMQKATGQIYSTSAEGDRTRYNRLSDLHRNEQDEITRSIEQLQERFRQSERFLMDLLQMRHDVTSQLYR